MGSGLAKDTFIVVAKEGDYNQSVLWRLKVRGARMIKEGTAESCPLLQTARVGVADCRLGHRCAR